ncbi:MAG: hypothetical protein GYB68_02070 [Chloroflexi bacterium]|nr:hypothetical protein [Chloroflexota bacterium]
MGAQVQPQGQVSAGREGTTGWIGQAVSGVLLLGLAGLHMVGHHYIVDGGLRDYGEVLQWIGQPLILFAEVSFLVVVTYHALAGVRSILFDLGLNEGQKKTVSRVLAVVGILTIVYGLFLAFTLFSRA